MKNYFKRFTVGLIAVIVFTCVSCGNSKYDKILDEYESIADEISVARKNNDAVKILELASELKKMEVKYKGLTVEDLSDEQRERLAKIMNKIIGYDDAIDAINQYKQNNDD